MSWMQYIKSMKDIAPGDMKWGAIIGKDGSIWEAEHQLSPQEIRFLTQSFNKKDFKRMQENGFYVCGQRYTFLFHDEALKLVVGKAKGVGGIHLQETKKAILIAFCPEGQQMGNVNKAVCHIGAHLSRTGY